MSRPLPTPEQLAAINCRARRILLEAGAGTGKTSVLVNRYCDRIEFDGLAPEELLAFTFTEKAGAEMSGRIRRELNERATTNPDPAVAGRLRDVANRLSGAWVMTIHAFCRRVLAAHPVAAGLDPELTVFDQTATTRIKHEAFELAFADLLGEAIAPEAETLGATYGLADLRSLLLATYDQLRSQGQVEPELPELAPTDPEPALARLQAAAETLFAGEYRRHRGTDEKISRAQQIAAERHQWLPLTTPPSQAYNQALRELSNLGHNSSIEAKAAVERERQTAVAAMVAAGSGEEALRVIAALLAGFHRRYSECKAARSGVDFDDLQLLTTELLRKNQAIGAHYRDRFREVMVDEFQDTSASQMRLIEALTGPETDLFQVGDEFQSIYRFRHADLENFRRQRREFQRDEDSMVLPLRGNFRSGAAILAAANAFSASLIPGFKPLTVGSGEQGESDTGDAVEMIVTSAKGWEEATNRPPAAPGITLTRAAEAEAVAVRLGELVAAGCPRSDIVVLLRAHSSAAAYVDALERHGLRPFVVGGRGYWLGREVADANALLRTIANPLDDEALFGALASPACAVSPDTLAILRRAAGRQAEIWPLLDAHLDPTHPSPPGPEATGWLRQIAAEEHERLAGFHRALRRLLRERERLSLADLIELALSLTGMDLALLRSAQGERRWAGMRKLIRIAGEYEAAEGRDLRGLIEHGELAAQVDDDVRAHRRVAEHVFVLIG